MTGLRAMCGRTRSKWSKEDFDRKSIAAHESNCPRCHKIALAAQEWADALVVVDEVTGEVVWRQNAVKVLAEKFSISTTRANRFIERAKRKKFSEYLPENYTG